MKTALLVGISILSIATARAEKTLWQIGTQNRNNAEFALAPKDFHKFKNDAVFIVGQSDAKKDWPYVHPGRFDDWAGTRRHHFVIFFGVADVPTPGNCRLILDLVDSHSYLPPTLQIDINGKIFERILKNGAGDNSIHGEPSQGKSQRVTVEFPGGILKNGNNQIVIANVEGSWMLYDCVSLEVPDSTKPAVVSGVDYLRSIESSASVVERDGKKFQRITGSLVRSDGAVQAVCCVDRAELLRTTFKKGENSFEAFVPAVNKARTAEFTIVADNRTVASSSVSVRPPLEEVIVVFKTHFDIGYTEMASNVVERYRTKMIDQALDVVDRNRNLPAAQQFVWTIPGWPMKKILDDWPGQTSVRKQRIESAFKEGRFVVHSLPFSTHTELLEIEDVVRGMGFSTRLSEGFGLQRPRDAKMTDVPEHTWALSTVLKHAGVDFMMIGCNGASGLLRVPRLFWWEGPDGSRTLTMYSHDYGTHLIPPTNWTYRTWLACLHTGDNHGPPRPEEVAKVLEEAAARLPGVRVRIGRMSDFADAILAEKPDLPVIRGDAPDTWIHGPMSDPAGAQIARNTRPLIGATDALNTQLRIWDVPIAPAAPAVAAAYEQSLLYGEHTWGGAIGWIDTRLSYGEEFKKDRAAGRFNRIEGSWAEHTSYIEAARDIITPELEKNLEALANNVGVSGKRVVVYNPLPWKRDGIVKIANGFESIGALKSSEGDAICPLSKSAGETQFVAKDIPPMGYRTFVPVKVELAAPPFKMDEKSASIETPFFRASFEPAHGTIRSLIAKSSNRELVDAASDYHLGQYLYERFDNGQVMGFATNYLRWMAADFYKPGLPDAKQVPYRAASPENFAMRFEQSTESIAAVFDSPATSDLPAVTTRVTFFADRSFVDLAITVHNKPFEAWPEAGWLCLPFKVADPQFHLGRLASIIDPARDVIAGANRHIFGLNTGVTITDSTGAGAGFCAMDSPLVSLDTPGCWKYSLDFIPKRPAAFVNLFNNQWNTNFRLWNSGTWTSRVRIWAVEKYDAEATLITPSLEARFPLQGAVAEGAAGKLPVTQAGVEVFRKNSGPKARAAAGIAVTAFGHNPDGRGTLLRLWEYAGKSGACEIRLPSGLRPASVQPVDLRGRSQGSPIPVKNGTFNVDLAAFSPMTVLIETR